MADMEVAVELGEQLGHLVKLARDEADPKLLMLGEEVEALTADDARALLYVAVIVLGERKVIP